MGWKNAPNKFSLDVIKTFDEKTKKTLGYGHQLLVVGAAVDTGAFRASMIFSADKPVSYFNKSDVDKSGSETISAAGASISSLKTTVGRVFYLQSNAPYGPRLENGWSEQQPTGLFARTTISMKHKFDNS